MLTICLPNSQILFQKLFLREYLGIKIFFSEHPETSHIFLEVQLFLLQKEVSALKHDIV